MQPKNSPKPPQKSKAARLHLIKAEKIPKPLRLSAPAASDDVRPADYVAVCQDCWLEQRNGRWRCVWQFTICDGPHHGVGVRKFKEFDPSGEVSPKSEFARACAIALKRPLNDDDDLSDPATIFAGKKFVVFIGYRKSQTASGGNASDELAYRKKAPDDKLKVHEIKRLLEL